MPLNTWLYTLVLTVGDIGFILARLKEKQ